MLKRTELLELIAGGESSTVEFMRDEVSPEALSKAIVALSNSRGGHVFLGVEDDRTVSGIRRNDLEGWVTDTVFEHVHPAIDPLYQEVRADDGRRVAVVSLAEGAAKPYVVRNQGHEDIYYRVGSTSRLATIEQQARLCQAGGLLRVELLPVSGSTLQDLSLERLAVHLTSVLRDSSLPRNDEEWQKRLCALDIMVDQDSGQPVCTIGGLVLFGHQPRRFLRHAGIRWMAFDGVEMSYRALDDRRIDGPLIALKRERSDGSLETLAPGIVESLESAMRPFISEESATVDESWSRSRSWHYPPDAVREAILNVLVHRDWTRFEEIEVVRYADRLEVLSPGALKSPMTVEKMIGGRHSRRNPMVASVLQYYGYVDARGIGVRNKIIPLVTEQSGIAPELRETEDDFRVTMLRKPSAGRAWERSCEPSISKRDRRQVGCVENRSGR